MVARGKGRANPLICKHLQATHITAKKTNQQPLTIPNLSCHPERCKFVILSVSEGSQSLDLSEHQCMRFTKSKIDE